MHEGDDTGRVTGGSLTLRGRLAAAKMCVGDNQTCALANEIRIERTESQGLHQLGKIGALGSVFLDTLQDTYENIFCLPVIIYCHPKYTRSKNHWEVRGLAYLAVLMGAIRALVIFTIQA
jgi:hypothetical protein